MGEFVKITFEGETTEIEIKPCHHCGKLPTAEDAEKAVAHERKTARTCQICGGKPPLYPKHALYHSVNVYGRGGFILCGTGEVEVDGDIAIVPKVDLWHSDWVTVWSSGPGGTVDGVFHGACLKKAIPGITIHPK